MGYPERPFSGIPPLPTGQLILPTDDDADEPCQACIDGMPHTSCEPYFDDGTDDIDRPDKKGTAP